MPRSGGMVGIVAVCFVFIARTTRSQVITTGGTTNCTLATCSSEELWDNFLPSNYSKSDPPFANGVAVLVNVSMKIVDVDDINEERMDFRLHTYIEESWHDSRLRTGPFANKWRRTSVPRRVARLIWAPDVVFSNTKKSSIFRQSVDSVAYKIARDGSVHRLTRYLFQVRCLMTFHKYPMDVQHCHFKVSLLATPNWIAELSWQSVGENEGEDGAVEFVDRIEPLQFRIKRPKVHRYSENFMGENYTHLLANFTFERRLTASIVNTYIPSGLVVVLSWLSFWLDVHAVQGRITLGVTAILTLTTQVVQSRTALPPVDYVKAVDIWLFACLISVFASLLEYAVAYQYVKSTRIGFQGDGGMSEEDITENDLLGSADSMGSSVSQRTLPATAPARLPDLLQQPHRIFALFAKFKFLSVTSSNVFDSVSRAVFPSAFILFMIAYWAHYLPGKLRY
ncbi:glycine receptor subunit alpha-2-like [Haemaphysalis longicornis]